MISHCRSCKSKRLSQIVSLGKSYLSDFVSRPQKPKSFPLRLVLCQECSLLQLKDTTPSSLLYTEHYGYRSGINQTMKDELSEIVEKAQVYLKNKPNPLVIDIGANDGTLISYYPKSFRRIAVEPIKKLALAAKEHATVVINDFFTFEAVRNELQSEKADLVTIISCFYDMEDPNLFVEDLAKILATDGVCIIQQNYLVKMLTQNAFDNIVHEHLEYYSLLSLQNLLTRHGLEVFHLELSELNGGSFRTYIGFSGKHHRTTAVYEQEQLEKLIGLRRKKIYRDFAKRISNTRKEVFSFIRSEVKKGKTIYVYGASTRGNTLLQYFKLDNQLITKAVERNEEKWGKYIASVSIPIISEEQARNEKPDYLLVLPWFFKEEFMQREKKYLESGGHFIFPLPNLEIV